MLIRTKMMTIQKVLIVTMWILILSITYLIKKILLIHLNIASLSRHKEELETILSMLNYKLGIMGITETKISKQSAPIIDMNIEGFNYYSTPTEAEKGGTLIYLSEKYNSKPKKDLELIMYKSKSL